MSVKETPLAKVKRLHSTKEALLDSLVADLAKENGEDEGELKQRLVGAPNSKLLRLAGAVRELKDKYGSKNQLADALSTAQGKAKDSDYVAKLRTLSIPALLDRMHAASKKTRAATK